MQANSKDRLLNMQIFAGLLRRVRKICVERFIGHLAIVDIEDASQSWYRDFFRLAGFSRCRCHSSDGSALQREAWNCVSLRGWLENNFPNVYDTVRIWLEEGRCTRALLDSVASGDAAEVERRFFHDLIAELENEKKSRSAEARMILTSRNRTRSQRPWLDSTRESAAPGRKALKHGKGFFSLSKHESSQKVLVKSTEDSVLRVREKRKRSQTTEKEDLWRARKAQKHQSRLC